MDDPQLWFALCIIAGAVGAGIGFYVRDWATAFASLALAFLGAAFW